MQLRELCERKQKLLFVLYMGKQRQRQTMEADRDQQPSNTDVHRPTTLSKENETFISHKSTCLGQESTNLVSLPESVS